MTSCNHTFVYHSVIPPSHCPLCGACLGCGQRTAPYQPYQPYWPTYPTNPYQGPFWYYQQSVTTNTVSSSSPTYTVTTT